METRGVEDATRSCIITGEDQKKGDDYRKLTAQAI